MGLFGPAWSTENPKHVDYDSYCISECEDRIVDLVF